MARASLQTLLDRHVHPGSSSTDSAPPMHSLTSGLSLALTPHSAKPVSAEALTGPPRRARSIGTGQLQNRAGRLRYTSRIVNSSTGYLPCSRHSGIKVAF
jgi:hypothetical protein